MGGIFGIINKNGGPVSEQDLSLMKENLAHLGIDGIGVKVYPGAGLGHLHFGLFPEYEKEVGPYEYGPWVITADARLDAREDLVKALELSLSEGLRTPDSILIIKAYEKWGEQCLDHLIGDFAFAVWDKRSQVLFGARDFAGIRPLFYYENQDKFVFSSEIRAIAALDWVPKKLNEGKLRDYLLTIRHGGDYVRDTFFQGIKRLMSGRFFLSNPDKLNIKQYWFHPEGPLIRYNSDQEYAEAFRHLIEEAVEDRIKTKFPIGVTLSGGLDSSSIACIAARRLAVQNRNLFSASSVMPEHYSGVEEDERAFIQAVLDQEYNIHASFVTAKNVGVFDDIHRVFGAAHYPVNVFHYMDNAIYSRLARDHHVRLILSGFGGDMAASYGGWNILGQTLKMFRFRAFHRTLLMMEKTFKRSYWKIARTSILKPLFPSNWVRKYHELRGYTSIPISERTTIGSYFLNGMDVQKYYDNYRKEIYHPWNLYKTIWNTNHLITQEDDAVISIQHGVRTTYPLLDKRVIEFLLLVPPEKFYMGGWGRGLIRFSMENILPPKVQWRIDKTLYSPDYIRRLVNNKGELLKKIKGWKKEFPELEKYINWKKLESGLSALEPVENWRSFDNRSISIVGMGFMAVHFLEYLNKEYNLQL